MINAELSLFQLHSSCSAVRQMPYQITYQTCSIQRFSILILVMVCYTSLLFLEWSQSQIYKDWEKTHKTIVPMIKLYVIVYGGVTSTYISSVTLAYHGLCCSSWNYWDSEMYVGSYMWHFIISNSAHPGCANYSRNTTVCDQHWWDHTVLTLDVQESHDLTCGPMLTREIFKFGFTACIQFVARNWSPLQTLMYTTSEWPKCRVCLTRDTDVEACGF